MSDSIIPHSERRICVASLVGLPSSRFTRSGVSAVIAASVLVASCSENQRSSAAGAEPGSTPTSESSPSPAPSQASVSALKRLVERGEGSACGHPLVVDYIRNEAIKTNSFPADLGWGGGWNTQQRAAYYADYKSELRDIVKNGSDPDAMRVSCGGVYYEVSPDRYFSMPVEYDVQATVDGGVVVTIQNLNEVQDTARQAVHAYYCDNIYPAQEREMGTPIGIVCPIA